MAFLNAWASTNTVLTGDADRFLASGLYGFDWAATAEIMRTYSGWTTAGFTAFQNYLLNVYYPLENDFLVNNNGAYITNYWGNWDLCNVEGMMAIGIFCDRHDLYQQAMNYLFTGPGNGTLDQVEYYLFSGNLGQDQESGRDQGHTLLEMEMLGDICQMAWNQGDNLYSYNNNEVLAIAEYVAKYNLGYNVPFETITEQQGAPGVWESMTTQTSVGSGSRGNQAPIYESIYAHYVSLEGLAAPWSCQRVMELRPEEWSGNGDSLGWGTLLYALPTSTASQPPQNLTARENVTGDIELDWFGGNNDTSYNVYRSTSQFGTYTEIASGIAGLLTYTDYNVPAGTYYYKVTGVGSSGEAAPSNVVSATSGALLQAQLLFNESSGTTANDATGNGWNGTLVGGASFTTAGHSGNAVALDGSSGYVSLPADILQPLNDFTVSAWVYLNSAAAWSRVFDFGSGQERWMFLTVANGSGLPQFSISTVYGFNEESVIGSSPLPLNQWVHLAVTLSGQVGTLYVNGVAVGSNANMAFAPFEVKDTSQDWLGRSQYSSDPYLNGKIDDFRIYQGAMSASAIYSLATGLAAPRRQPRPPTCPRRRLGVLIK